MSELLQEYALSKSMIISSQIGVRKVYPAFSTKLLEASPSDAGTFFIGSGDRFLWTEDAVAQKQK